MDYAATILSKLPGALKRDHGMRLLVDTLQTYLPEEQVDVIVGMRSTATTQFYFSKSSGRLVGFDTEIEPDVDACEVRFGEETVEVLAVVAGAGESVLEHGDLSQQVGENVVVVDCEVARSVVGDEDPDSRLVVDVDPMNRDLRKSGVNRRFESMVAGKDVARRRLSDE